jgi:hypothetical protein
LSENENDVNLGSEEEEAVLFLGSLWASCWKEIRI